MSDNLCLLKIFQVEAANSYPHQPLYISTGILHRLLTEPSSSGEGDLLYGSLSVHPFLLSCYFGLDVHRSYEHVLFIPKAERSTVRHFIPIACLLAYGLPAACALLVVFLDNSTDFQSASYCFIHPGYALYFGFLMEVGAMFVFNFIIFIWVIRKILCRPLMVRKQPKTPA
ncbi:putative G-protein coupled receptor [Apostichopus japonicus]|uniref:Putative G-protein coupled receptor n=1 Tax=Stichopus japonicus TaxID=307972 RepID=A0A2G8K812_STIJA|nr:putative G-protein coupled receptor [Apostichopus japonicus]